jgi:hypothetical protein
MSFPRSWLQSSTDLEAVRKAQHEDTLVTADDDVVELSGTELVLEADWFGRKHWRTVAAAIRRGYIERAEEDLALIHAERRSGASRRAPVLLAKLRERSRV